jgi:hypothetical protein
LITFVPIDQSSFLPSFFGFSLVSSSYEMIAGSTVSSSSSSSSSDFFSMISNVFTRSTLNLTVPRMFSFGGISFSPFLRPSVPNYLTFLRLMVFLTLSTSVRVPSYLLSAFVINEMYDPIILEFPCSCYSLIIYYN